MKAIENRLAKLENRLGTTEDEESFRQWLADSFGLPEDAPIPEGLTVESLLEKARNTAVLPWMGINENP
jgi:hypothetical protein